MCLAPITLKRETKTMQGSLTNVVPCGKCPRCLKRRLNAWAFRLVKEMEQSTSAIFLTLTYENAPTSFNGHHTLIKSDYQKFTKRLRKNLQNSNIKYYACGEYGTTTQRPHYHAIVFNLPQTWITNSNKLLDIWGHGHINISPCNIATIKYVCKYVMKGKFTPTTDHDDRNSDFSIMSKKMGLNYLTPQIIRYHQDNLKSFITLPGGIPTSMPRYFRDKIFTKEHIQQINKKQILQRDIEFETRFDSNYRQQSIWTKDQYRKAAKVIKTDRDKI